MPLSLPSLQPSLQTDLPPSLHTSLSSGVWAGVGLRRSAPTEPIPALDVRSRRNTHCGWLDKLCALVSMHARRNHRGTPWKRCRRPSDDGGSAGHERTGNRNKYKKRQKKTRKNASCAFRKITKLKVRQQKKCGPPVCVCVSVWEAY